MANPVSVLIGPLAGPECRRAASRGWLIVVRLLAALALLGAASIALWACWMDAAADPNSMPFEILGYGLVAVEGMLVTVALVLAPAVLAGSIAGEKERGVMALLLTTSVRPREIVLGRLAGKLTQVAMVLMAGLPALVALAAYLSMGAATLAVLMGLPAAVAVGGGGIAVLASTVSRRGRDALLTVYLLDILFLVSPLAGRLGLSSRLVAWLGVLDPFGCVGGLVWYEAFVPPLVSSALWLAMGLVASLIAGWRLRPAALRPQSGERLLRRARRFGHVPPVDEKRPMLWKELAIERVGALGGLGWWLGALLTLTLAVTSVVLAGLWFGVELFGVDEVRAEGLMTLFIGGTAAYVGCLIEWAVGLRAAVAISSERERGTWDALLTSPLEGREIVRAKLWGSLHAIRWLLAATLLAWSLAAVCGSISPWNYAVIVAYTAIATAFMAAVGVRTSLSAPTATRAMATTIGVWLGAWVAFRFLAGILLGIGFLLVSISMQLATMGSFGPAPGTLRLIGYAWPVTVDAVYLLATISIVADTRLRFDRIAGRMTAGRMATAIDRLIHGKPADPWRPWPEPVTEPEASSSAVA
jgi:ABC-type transport system involved in multi-copper enzyme maturation permease subunit